MFTTIEQDRLKTGLALVGKFTTHQWQHYFTYLLGRPVTLEETNQFLHDTAHSAVLPRELQETR